MQYMEKKNKIVTKLNKIKIKIIITKLIKIKRICEQRKYKKATKWKLVICKSYEKNNIHCVEK